MQTNKPTKSAHRPQGRGALSRGTTLVCRHLARPTSMAEPLQSHYLCTHCICRKRYGAIVCSALLGNGERRNQPTVPTTSAGGSVFGSGAIREFALRRISASRLSVSGLCAPAPLRSLWFACLQLHCMACTSEKTRAKHLQKDNRFSRRTDTGKCFAPTPDPDSSIGFLMPGMGVAVGARHMWLQASGFPESNCHICIALVASQLYLC